MSKNYVEIEASELLELLVADGHDPAKVQLADSLYVLPTETAVQAFGQRFFRFVSDTKLAGYMAEVWDCDKFARVAGALAAVDHAYWAQKTGVVDAALAFGVAWVRTPEDGGHAINCAVHVQAGRKVVVYYEPQPQRSGNGYAVCLKSVSRASFVSPLWACF